MNECIVKGCENKRVMEYGMLTTMCDEHIKLYNEKFKEALEEISRKRKEIDERSGK